MPSAAPQHASVATHLTDENGKLPLWIKTTFAVPRFTIRASYIIQSAYVVFFYETIGAKLTYIAAYVAIARSFDVITGKHHQFFFSKIKFPMQLPELFFRAVVVRFSLKTPSWAG